MRKDCTIFASDEAYDEWVPCRCPACNGFLPMDFPIGHQFQCKRCGVVLETLPISNSDLDDDEQDVDMEFGGMICKVPNYAVKIEIKKYPRPPRNLKHRTDYWVVGEKFIRRVWKDKIGMFVNVAGERIELTDPRVLNVLKDSKERVTKFVEEKRERARRLSDG